MDSTLAEQFRRSGGETIQFGDHTVHSIYRHTVTNGCLVEVSFLAYDPETQQGLGLSIKQGWMLVNEQKLRNMVLWQHTAPDVVEMKCQTRKGQEAILNVWNVWRGSLGNMDAWIGNAGMIIKSESEHIILECSDGIGAVNFKDLVVRLRFGC